MRMPAANASNKSKCRAPAPRRLSEPVSPPRGRPVVVGERTRSSSPPVSAWPSPSETRCSSSANLAFLDIFAQPVFRTTGLARTAKGSTAARQLCGTRRSHGAAATLSRRAALGGEVA